jgi:hypothetical protein
VRAAGAQVLLDTEGIDTYDQVRREAPDSGRANTQCRRG